jgi:hypothetical protein
MRSDWMPQRLVMEFAAATETVRTPGPQLGGQPLWLEQPTWPQSKDLGAPMMFVGQFPIPNGDGSVAYLFMTDDPDAMAPTFEPESGENAVIVQPGGRVPTFVDVTDEATGPSLWRRGRDWDEHVPVELEIGVRPATEAENRRIEEEIALNQGQQIELSRGVAAPRSFLGGSPCHWQPTAPLQHPWRFLLQLDGREGWAADDHYALNFGGGTGYLYLSADGREGRFFWDCL